MKGIGPTRLTLGTPGGRPLHPRQSKSPSHLSHDDVVAFMKNGAVLRRYHRTQESALPGTAHPRAGILNSLRLSNGTVFALASTVMKKLMENPEVVETPSGTPHYTYYKIKPTEEDG